MRENAVLDIPDDLIRASISLGAGLGFCRQTCGALMGGGLALGLKFGRRDLTGSRRGSWSRMARLVERFERRYGTASCEELTGNFPIAEFASPGRIESCMDIIAFVTRETADLLSDPDDTFDDPQKEAYFRLREPQSR